MKQADLLTSGLSAHGNDTLRCWWPSSGPRAGRHHQGPAQHLLPPHAASTSTIRTCRAREIEHHAVDLAIANTSVTERLRSGFLIQENLTLLDGHGT